MNWLFLNKSRGLYKVGADCRAAGGWQRGFLTVSPKASSWCDMETTLCKGLAAQMSQMKAGELARYLGKA